MKTLISSLSLIIGLGLSVVLLAGCSNNPSKVASNNDFGAVNKKACEGNVFLQRYGCSLTSVEQAAEKNDPDAEYALGYMYYNGIGTVSDPDTAYIWIQRATDQGQPLAVKAIQAIRAAQFPKMGKVNIKTKAVKQSRKAHVHLAHHLKQSKTHMRKVSKAADASKQITVLNNTTIEQMPAHHYTLQLLAAHKLVNVKHYRKALKNADNAYIVATKKNGAKWYVLLSGNYTTSMQAKVAANKIAQNKKLTKPWVRSFASLKTILANVH